MKIDRLLIIPFLLVALLGSSIISFSQSDSSQTSTLKDYYREYRLIPQLYIKRTGENKKRKIRVREGALVNCQLVDYTYTGISYLKIIAEEGIYIGPLHFTSDSITTRKSKEKEVIALKSDTIIYIPYKEILTFSFRNDVRNQNDGAGTLLFLGSELVFAPIIITPFVYGSFEDVPPGTIIGFVGAGAPLIIAGVVWKFLLRKFRSYPMQNYDFVFAYKTD